MEYPKQLLGHFKNDYHSYGKFHFDVQVPHLVKLAGFYERRYKLTKHWTDCVKAHALYNSINRRQPQSLWEERAFEVQQEYWADSSSVTLERQKLLNSSLKRDIKSIREKCRKELSAADELANSFGEVETSSEHVKKFFECMKQISQDCTDAMAQFAGRMIRESVDMLKPGKPPCDFVAVAFGSLARGEATPYSDLEFFFLVEQKNHEIMKYFENLSITTYFQIGNLGETKLSYMAIDELKGWFDDQAKNGFKIDGLTDQAGNIPTGNGSSHQHNHLIVTPDELAKRYRKILNKPDEEKALRGDLTAMLTYMKPLVAYEQEKESLFEKLQNMIRNSSMNSARLGVNRKMLQTDARKFDFSPSYDLILNGLNVNVKREIYRFPSILLLDINIVMQMNENSSWQSLKLLQERKHISSQLQFALRLLLASAAYMRMSAYLHHDSQDERISLGQEKSSSKQRTKSKPTGSQCRWFVPIRLFTTMCKNMIMVKWKLSNSSKIVSDLKAFKFDENNPWSGILTLFYMGRHLETLDLLKREYGDNLCDDPLAVIRKVTKGQDVDEILSLLSQTLFFCKIFKAALMVYEHMPQDKRSILQRIRTADCYRELGNYYKSLDILKSIEAKSYDQHLHSLGSTYFKTKDYPKSEQSFLEALDLKLYSGMSEQLYDYYGNPINSDEPTEKSPLSLKNITSPEERLSRITYISYDVILCVSGLGMAHAGQGQYTISNSYFEKALLFISEFYGEGAAVSLAAEILTFLGNNFNQMGQYCKGLDHYNQALQVYRELPPGTADVQFANTMNNRGTCLTAMGKHDEAMDHYKQSLVVMNDLLKKTTTNEIGEAHILSNLGLMLMKTGKHSEVEEYLKRSLVLHGNLSQGATNDDIASTIRCLGNNYCDLGRYSEAVGYSSQALAIYRKYSHGDPSDDIAETLSEIGVSYMKMGQYKEAEERLTQASISFRKLPHGTSSRVFAGTQDNLGVLNNLIGQYMKAADYHQNALDVYTELSGSIGSQCIAATLYKIGHNHSKMGNLDDAEKNHILAVAAYRNISKREKDPNLIAGILSSLGLVHSLNEQFSKAKYYYKQSLALYRELTEGASNSELALLLSNLGTNYIGVDDKKAIGYLRESVHIYIKLDSKNRRVEEIWDKLAKMHHHHRI